jgi:hypothetical protein
MGVNAEGHLVVGFWIAKDAYDFQDGLGKWTGYYPGRPLNNYRTISTDGGLTWSEPEPLNYTHIKCGSPYGRIITAPDGTLLMSVYGIPADDETGKKNMICLIRSRDGGLTWGMNRLSPIISMKHPSPLCRTAYSSLPRATGATALIQPYWKAMIRAIPGVNRSG